MEINITSLLNMDAFALSHSRHEGGDLAGTNTWNASKEQAEANILLDTEEKLEAMRDFAHESGGWSREEIERWDTLELNALFLQWVAGDVRQMPLKYDFEFTEREGEWFRDDEDGESEWGPYESRSAAWNDIEPGSQFKTAESLEDIDWDETEVMQAEGILPSNLFKGDGGQIYFYLGN